MVTEKQQEVDSFAVPNIEEFGSVSEYLNMFPWPSTHFQKSECNKNKQGYQVFEMVKALTTTKHHYPILDSKIKYNTENRGYSLKIEHISKSEYPRLSVYGFCFKIRYTDLLGNVSSIAEQCFSFRHCKMNPDKGPYNFKVEPRIVYDDTGKPGWYCDVEPLSLEEMVLGMQSFLNKHLRPGSLVIV
jgi:hypothetical protein